MYSQDRLPLDQDFFYILSLCGDVKMIYPFISSGVTIVSFFDLQNAEIALKKIQSIYSYCKTFYMKPRFIKEPDHQIILIVIKSQNQEQLLNFNAYNFLSQFGSIHMLNEICLNHYSRVVSIEFHDQRSSQKTYIKLNNAVHEGLTFDIYENNIESYTGVCPSKIIEANTQCKTSATTSASTAVSWSDFASRPPGSIEKKSDSENTNIQRLSKCESEFSLFSNQPFHTASNSNSGCKNTQSKRGSLDTNISLMSSSDSQQDQSSYDSVKSKGSSYSSKKKEDVHVIDFEKIKSGKERRTTFMIRNIPNKYTQSMLKNMIDTTHQSTYDFLYLRMDFKNHCNVGYAFINFIDAKSAVTFAEKRMGKKWNMFNSDKKLSLSFANIQGKETLVRKFKNSHVMLEDESYRPKLFYSSGYRQGQEQPFPSSEAVSQNSLSLSNTRHSR
ncbi:unnamed protein product [Rhizopus stolonifer]